MINKYRKELETWQRQVERKIKEKLEYYHLKEKANLSSIEKTLKQKIIYSVNHTYLMKDVERSRNAFFNPDVFKALKKNESDGSWIKRTSRMSQALVENSTSIYLINGEHDYIDPTGHVWKEIDKYLDRLNYFLIPEAGHNIWLDQPSEFSKILEEILN